MVLELPKAWPRALGSSYEACQPFPSPYLRKRVCSWSTKISQPAVQHAYTGASVPRHSPPARSAKEEASCWGQQG